MKLLIVTLLALTAVYCANMENLCTEAERNVFGCPDNHDPVCAIQKTDNIYSKVTIFNRCEACLDKKTEYIVSGECENYPKEAAFCNPKYSENWACIEIFKPVCGYDDSSIQCISPPCAQTYSNGCIACTHSNVSYFLPGKCPGKCNKKKI